MAFSSSALRHGAAFLAAACLALTLGAALAAEPARTAVAVGANQQHKLARDLALPLADGSHVGHRWSRRVGDQHLVQIVVLSDSADPELAALRAHVLRLGGSVHARHPLVNGLTVQVPASQLAALAAHADVASVSPNRAVRGSASLLETDTGASAAKAAVPSNIRVGIYDGNGVITNYSGLDGSGVGIAILDSGVMRGHRSFLSGSGVRRVQRNVNMLNANLANWLVGVDSSLSPAPGSAALAGYEAAIAADNAVTHDAYGHGTHVAAVAAGRGLYQVPDTTGVAPGANVYDVKVLGANGSGSLSDVLEGIAWVVFHAREYNIRVLNLSLAASSSESWQTDPLCLAVRRATAAGITVVVAAGNFGQTAAGAEVYGAISAPGNDPSVITVGSTNAKTTAWRSDDQVNFFSSRGPTRSARTVNSVRVPDNLLKPDLVALGNRTFAAAATSNDPSKPVWNTLAAANPDLVGITGGSQVFGQTLMSLSGTSIAAPTVAGTVALMLQANPGLTPPLIKAILQFTAQVMNNANPLQQGAGLLNADGAVAVAKALRTDIASAIEGGRLVPGASLLASGAVRGLRVEAGRIVADIARNALTVAVITVVAVAMGFRFQNGLLGAVVYFAVPLAVGFGVAWFMVTVAMSADSAESAVGSLNAVLLLLTFFSTGFVKLDDLPGWAQPIASANPVSHIAAAMRSATTAGEPVFGFDAWVSVAWAVGLTVVFGFLATKAYSRSR